MHAFRNLSRIRALLLSVATIVGTAIPIPSFSQQTSEAEMHAQRAQAAIASNQPDVASVELQALLNLQPDDVNARASLGMVQFTQGRYRQSADNFQAVITRSPALWNARAFLGMCEIRLGRPARGQSLLQDTFPHLTDKTLRKQAALELISSYLSSGMSNKAVAIADQLQREFSADPDVLYAVYRLHSDLASTALHQLSQNAPDSARFHQVLGDAMLVQGDYSRSIDEYRQALDRSSALVGAHLGIGEAMLSGEKNAANTKSAEEEFRAELRIDPENPDALFQLGQIAYEHHDVDGAAKLFIKSLDGRPSFPEAHVALAKICSDRNLDAEAIKHLETAIALAPGNRTAHYRLAQLYKKAGESAKADEQFELARKLGASENRALPLAGSAAQQH